MIADARDLLQPMTWDSFVHMAARQFSRGLTERDAGQAFTGKRIRWTGSVQELRRNGGSVHSIAVYMPKIAVNLDDHRVFVGEFLSLPLDNAQERKKAGKLKSGDRIEFSATVSPNDGVFECIGFTDDDEQNAVFLEVGLEDVAIHKISS